MTLTRCWICTNRHSTSRWEDNTFWTALDWLVEGVLEHEQQMFVLMDANARTGRKGGGRLVSVECKVLGAYGRDTLNGNGDRLFSITNNYGLALFKSFFSTAKKAILHTFGGEANKKSTTFSRGSEVDTSCRTLQCTSNHHSYPSSRITTYIVKACVKLLGRFTRNRPVRRARRPPPVSTADS